MHITPTVVTRLAHAASNNQSDNVLPRITVQGPATAAAATPAIRIHRLSARLLRRLAPRVVLQHRRDFCSQQGHEVTHKIQLGVVKAPFLTDRQYRPAVQMSRYLRRPVPGAARHPAMLLWPLCLEQMAGSPGLRQQQAIQHVGPSHSSAVGHGEGDPDGPFPPQIAVLHQRLDQPAEVPGA
jgi:hypothetical protein